MWEQYRVPESERAWRARTERLCAWVDAFDLAERGEEGHRRVE